MCPEPASSGRGRFRELALSRADWEARRASRRKRHGAGPGESGPADARAEAGRREPGVGRPWGERTLLMGAEARGGLGARAAPLLRRLLGTETGEESGEGGERGRLQGAGVEKGVPTGLAPPLPRESGPGPWGGGGTSVAACRGLGRSLLPGGFRHRSDRHPCPIVPLRPSRVQSWSSGEGGRGFHIPGCRPGWGGGG